MCGIVAVISSERGELDRLPTMVDALEHRGPDDTGITLLADSCVGLAMRRLAIVDREGGRQPMWDAKRRYCLIFNGEIYNADALRQELASLGHTFRTSHSDTEVVVEGLSEWGTSLLSRLDGMFAIAAWSMERSELLVARDRSGEKPVFLCQLPSGWIAASELKAALVSPALSRELDPVGLDQYFSFGFTVAPRSIFRAVQKLPPGSFVWLNDRGGQIEIEPYWTPDYAGTTRVTETSGDAAQTLYRLLDDSVAERLIADVPVGLFLSGGLDSTTIGYFMGKHAGSVESFSIGFSDKGADESDYARLAARCLGTRHHVEVLGDAGVSDLMESVTEMLDEPMSDPSCIPTLALSRLTSRHVTVALGGDGSDELLMGYRTYQVLRVLGLMAGAPLWLRQQAAGAARSLPALRGRFGQVARIAATLDAGVGEQLLRRLGGFKGDGRAVLAQHMRGADGFNVFAEPLDSVRAYAPSAHGSMALTAAVYARTYLPDDILTKVDRASMACSLEVRAPFLDPAIVDFANALPVGFKLRGLTRKHVLRQAMRGKIPNEIIDRPKQGFGVPLDSWLRGPARDLAQTYLTEDRLRDAGVFDVACVRRVLEEHMTGRSDLGNELWSLLHFELWRERWA